MGVTRGEVRAVLGPPDHEDAVSMSYGDARVFLVQDRVNAWLDPSHMLQARSNTTARNDERANAAVGLASRSNRKSDPYDPIVVIARPSSVYHRPDCTELVGLRFIGLQLTRHRLSEVRAWATPCAKCKPYLTP